MQKGQLNSAEVADETAFLNATGRLDYKLTNDYLFHVVMQKNEKVLRGLIGSLLHLRPDEITSVELKNPIILGEAIDDKSVILDLRIVLNDTHILNIEMQVAKRDNWTERSLVYLCKNFDNLSEGQDYGEVMPCLHIGILDFELFKGDEEFYSKYRLQSMGNGRIYTTKFGINVLNLRHIDNATDEDIADELDVWARLFKAETWEDMIMLAKDHEFAKEAATSIYAVSSDEAVKLQCEARERYERDWANSYKSGERRGIKTGIRIERKNTERERERADKAEKRVKELEAMLKKGN